MAMIVKLVVLERLTETHFLYWISFALYRENNMADNCSIQWPNDVVINMTSKGYLIQNNLSPILNRRVIWTMFRLEVQRTSWQQWLNDEIKDMKIFKYFTSNVLLRCEFVLLWWCIWGSSHENFYAARVPLLYMFMFSKNSSISCWETSKCTVPFYFRSTNQLFTCTHSIEDIILSIIQNHQRWKQEHLSKIGDSKLCSPFWFHYPSSR